MQPLSGYLVEGKKMTKMTLLHKRVVNPVDFDEHSIQAIAGCSGIGKVQRREDFPAPCSPADSPTSGIIDHCRLASISRLRRVRGLKK
jgi:hypothetical protein